MSAPRWAKHFMQMWSSIIGGKKRNKEHKNLASKLLKPQTAGQLQHTTHQKS